MQNYLSLRLSFLLLGYGEKRTHMRVKYKTKKEIRKNFCMECSIFLGYSTLLWETIVLN